MRCAGLQYQGFIQDYHGPLSSIPCQVVKTTVDSFSSSRMTAGAAKYSYLPLRMVVEEPEWSTITPRKAAVIFYRQAYMQSARGPVPACLIAAILWLLGAWVDALTSLTASILPAVCHNGCSCPKSHTTHAAALQSRRAPTWRRCSTPS